MSKYNHNSPKSGELFSLPHHETSSKEVAKNHHLIQGTINEGFDINQLREESLSKRWGIIDAWIETPLYRAVQNGNAQLFNVANKAHVEKYVQSQEVSMHYSRMKFKKGFAAFSVNLQAQYGDFILGQHMQLQSRIKHYQRIFMDSMKDEYRYLETIPKEIFPDLHALQMKLMKARVQSNAKLVKNIFEGFAKAIDDGVPQFLIS